MAARLNIFSILPGVPSDDEDNIHPAQPSQTKQSNQQRLDHQDDNQNAKKPRNRKGVTSHLKAPRYC